MMERVSLCAAFFAPFLITLHEIIDEKSFNSEFSHPFLQHSAVSSLSFAWQTFFAPSIVLLQKKQISLSRISFSRLESKIIAKQTKAKVLLAADSHAPREFFLQPMPFLFNAKSYLQAPNVVTLIFLYFRKGIIGNISFF